MIDRRGMALAGLLILLSLPVLAAEPPAEIAAPGMNVALSVHAIGAQIYACLPKSGGGAPQWTFREPLATLIADGRTIGRHFAGPTWELDDGSLVKGKVAASAPGATADDIPLLKVNVTSSASVGWLKDVTVVQRLETKGGAKSGACDKPGELVLAPYTADYVFLRP